LLCDLPLLLLGYGLNLKGEFLLYLLLSLVALLLAVFVYRYTLPPVPVWQRAVLSGLRTLALVAILLLLFEPVLNIFRHRLEKQNVVVLVDKSASMSADDASGSRDETVERLLEGPGLAALKAKTRLRYFAFADSVWALTTQELDTTASTGASTNLSFAWEKAERAFPGQSVASVLLISDGGNNLGPNPVRLAGQSSIPIHTIGVGDTAVRRDAALSEILANDVTYLNSVVPIDVRVRATGLDGKTGQLRLLDRSGGEIASAAVRFSGEVSEVPVTLRFTATQVGNLRYRVVLDSISGEWSLANNRRSVMIRVLETRSQVVILSGPPMSSLSVLRHTLESDSNLEVRTFVESVRGGYLLGNAPTRGDLASASLLVLINFPSGQTPADLLTTLAEVVSGERIPVMFFAGPATHRDKFARLAEIIPSEAKRGIPRETEVTLREVIPNPVLTGRTPLPVSWDKLPPVFGGNDNFSAGPLAEVAVAQSRVTLGIPEDEPAIILWSGGGRKGVGFLVWETYRWKLGLAKDTRAAGFYDDLIGRLTRWLISPLEEKRVRIAPSKSLFSGGERVVFQAQVYGTDLAPRDDAAVIARVTNGEHSEVVPLRGRGNGRYDGAFRPWGEGDYRFEGIAYVNEDTLGRDRGSFAVETFSVEMLDTRQHADILRQIAEASGGRYVPAEGADTMLAHIESPPIEIEQRREIPLWNRALMLWVIVGVLGLEWFVRKRSGML